MTYIRNMYGEIIEDAGKAKPTRADPAGIANLVIHPDGSIDSLASARDKARLAKVDGHLRAERKAKMLATNGGGK
jgi:hypothetical protein